MSIAREEGSVAVQYLIVLLFLASAAIAAASIVSRSRAYANRSEAAYSGRKELEAATLEAMDLLKNDETPDYDGPDDAIWSLEGTTESGITREIRDVSSAINPNFIRKGPLENTALASLLAPDASPAALQQFREDEGLSLDSQHYAAFFTEEAFKGTISPYGWANINITDEFALQSLCRAATGSADTAEAFHVKIQNLLMDLRTISEAELPSFLGLDFDSLYPLINASPSMNVNTVDPLILRELLSYPAYKLESASAKAEVILSLRETAAGVSPESLFNILAVPEGHPLLSYFGCRTWFWKITAKNERESYSAVIARYPDDSLDPSGKPRFVIVERSFDGT